MSSIKRNLWILITLSAVFIVAQNYFLNQSPSRHYVKCEMAKKSCKKERKRTCSYQLKQDENSPLVIEISTESDMPQIDAFISVDQAPVPLNMNAVRANISYPNLAHEAGIEGKVVARILIDEEGMYMRHKLINTSHPVLANAVESHLKDLVFSPAVSDGEEVKFWVNVPFRFEVDK